MKWHVCSLIPTSLRQEMAGGGAVTAGRQIILHFLDGP